MKAVDHLAIVSKALHTIYKNMSQHYISRHHRDVGVGHELALASPRGGSIYGGSGKVPSRFCGKLGVTGGLILDRTEGAAVVMPDGGHRPFSSS